MELSIKFPIRHLEIGRELKLRDFEARESELEARRRKEELEVHVQQRKGDLKCQKEKEEIEAQTQQQKEECEAQQQNEELEA